MGGDCVDSGEDRLLGANAAWLGGQSDGGRKAGVSSEMAGKMKALEREVRELRQANEILRKASAYFA